MNLDSFVTFPEIDTSGAAACLLTCKLLRINFIAESTLLATSKRFVSAHLFYIIVIFEAKVVQKTLVGLQKFQQY